MPSLAQSALRAEEKTTGGDSGHSPLPSSTAPQRPYCMRSRAVSEIDGQVISRVACRRTFGFFFLGSARRVGWIRLKREGAKSSLPYKRTGAKPFTLYKGSCASFSHTRIVSAAGQSQSRNQAPPTMEMHADDRLRRLGPGLVWVARFAG